MYGQNFWPFRFKIYNMLNIESTFFTTKILAYVFYVNIVLRQKSEILFLRNLQEQIVLRNFFRDDNC